MLEKKKKIVSIDSTTRTTIDKSNWIHYQLNSLTFLFVYLLLFKKYVILLLWESLLRKTLIGHGYIENLCTKNKQKKNIKTYHHLQQRENKRQRKH